MADGRQVRADIVSAYRAQADMFAAALALMDAPAQAIEIPFEETTLPGYFFSVAADDRQRPTVILTGGYDGTAEELYVANGAAAVARGYNWQRDRHHGDQELPY